ncbi:hypothetical protein L6R50_13995 [Myxococcota bacterium]|nr:hypothetical protein [Myxococcota bacterium]
MGATFARAGRPEQAREAYARAAERAEGAGAAHLAARARLGESEAALVLGDAAGALASARAALGSVAVTGDAAHEAEAAVHLCAAALDLAPDLARTRIRLALAAPPHPGAESALARLRALEARRPGR